MQCKYAFMFIIYIKSSAPIAGRFSSVAVLLVSFSRPPTQ